MFNKIFKSNIIKNNKKYIFLGIFLFLVIFLGGVNRTEAAVPTLSSISYGGVTSTSASVSAHLDAINGFSIQNNGFCYNTTSSYLSYPGGPHGIICTSEAVSDTPRTFSSNLTGLTPNTTYYFIAYAVNASGTGYSSSGSFTTLNTTYSLSVSSSGHASGSVTGTCTSAASPCNINHGTSVSLSASTKYGYNYLWTATGAASSCNGSTSQSCTFTMTSAATASVAYVAQARTITFNANGGSGTMSPQSTVTDATVTLNSNTFTRSGYIFGGWATSAGGAVAYSDGASYTIGYQNVTLYAVWLQIYTVSFSSSGSSATNYVSPGTNDASMQVTSGVSLPIFVLVASGYYANISGCGGTPMTVYDTVFNAPDAVYYATITSNCTITTTWIANSYNYSFNSDGGTPTYTTVNQAYGSVVEDPGTPTQTGMTFEGWLPELPIFMHLGGGSSTAQWSWTEYNLSIVSNGGTIGGSGAGIMFYGEEAEITQTPPTGYTFTGWTSTDSVCTGTGNCIFNMPAKNVTVTANYTINTYTITASSGSNGTVTPTGVTIKDYNTSQVYSITPSTNYHIVSVFVDSVSQGAISSYTFSNISANHTISATFAIDTYNLYFQKNGATGSSNYNQPVPVFSSITLPTPDWTYTGYSFAGWNTAANGSGTSYSAGGSFTMPAQVTDLYAQWTPNSYYLTVNSNGGTISGMNSAEGNKDYNTHIIFNVPTRTGYTFAGWTGGTCSGTSTCDFYMPANNVIVTATWALISYNVYTSITGGAYGSVSPTGPVSVNSGDTTSFIISPNYGYYATVSGCGGSSTGYTKGITYTTGLITSDCTVSVDFIVDYWTLTINANEGTITGTHTSSTTLNYNTYVSLNAPTRTGYTFAGWTGGTCSGTGSCTFNMPDNGVTVTANWTINLYTITFNKNGGDTEANPTTRTTNYNTTVTLPTAPSRIYI